jgi:hypothetical protein
LIRRLQRHKKKVEESAPSNKYEIAQELTNGLSIMHIPKATSSSHQIVQAWFWRLLQAGGGLQWDKRMMSMSPIEQEKKRTFQVSQNSCHEHLNIPSRSVVVDSQRPKNELQLQTSSTLIKGSRLKNDKTTTRVLSTPKNGQDGLIVSPTDTQLQTLLTDPTTAEPPIIPEANDKQISASGLRGKWIYASLPALKLEFFRHGLIMCNVFSTCLRTGEEH